MLSASISTATERWSRVTDRMSRERDLFLTIVHPIDTFASAFGLPRPERRALCRQAENPNDTPISRVDPTNAQRRGLIRTPSPALDLLSTKDSVRSVFNAITATRNAARPIQFIQRKALPEIAMGEIGLKATMSGRNPVPSRSWPA